MKGISLSVTRQLDRFDLRADLALPGEGVSVLFGPSGSGKTTLLRFLAGLDREAKGSLEVGSVSWQDDRVGFSLPAHQRPVGYVFQDAALFPHLSVLDNLCFGMHRVSGGRTGQELNEVISMLDLGPLLRRLPSGLSGGEQQRVAIGRALLVQPEVLLMDEPLASLDPAMKREILPYFEALQQRRPLPMVYVTHSVSEAARLADHLVRLETGRVVAEGPVESMMEVLSPTADEEEVGVVIRGRVIEKGRSDGLVRLAFEGGEIWVAGKGWPVGSSARCRILPSDVSVSLTILEESSILNRLEAIVIRVAPAPGGVQALVQLRIGNTDLYSLVSERSVQALGLEPGRSVVAQFKASSIIG